MSSKDARFQYIRSWLTRGGSPLLIKTASDTDQHALALRLAAQGLCSLSTGCGACVACRLVAAGTHPDATVWQPNGAVLTVAEARSIRGTVSRRPFGDKRMVMVCEAEKTSAAAAAAWLKLLEEPSPTTRIVLLTAWPSRLLPTIRSRVTLVLAPSEADRRPPPGDEDDEEAYMRAVAGSVGRRLQQGDISPALKVVIRRVRDYYTIAAERGNVELAKAVVRVSLPDDIRGELSPDRSS